MPVLVLSVWALVLTRVYEIAGVRTSADLFGVVFGFSDLARGIPKRAQTLVFAGNLTLCAF